MQAIGRLAIQIFTAHVAKSSSNSPGGNRSRMLENMGNIDEYLASNLALIDDPMQKDFVRCCFDSKSLETVWLHPLLNYIYSLKILSVYSIFAYFQEKRQQEELMNHHHQQQQQQHQYHNNRKSSLSKSRKSSSKLAFAHTDSTTGFEMLISRLLFKYWY